MATEIREKVEFNFEELRVENPMKQQSWEQFVTKLNEMTAGEVDFSKVRTGAGSEVHFGHVVAVSITAEDIAANTITASEIAANSITASEIAANTITASEIAANSITASEIQANSITASKIDVNELSAISADLGSITAGDIDAVTITGSTITGSTVRTASVGNFHMSIENTNSSVNPNGLAFREGSTLLAGITSTITGVVTMFGRNTGSRSELILNNGFISVNGDLLPQSSSDDLGSSGSNWRRLYAGDIYSGSSRKLNLQPSSGPQWLTAMGLRVQSSFPGSASAYQGYMYFDPTKGGGTIVFSDGSGWFGVQASSV